MVLFADDTTLLNTHNNKNFLEFSIVHDLDILMTWFKANQLLLNLGKTVVINFWEHQGRNSVTLGRIEIPIVTSTKFLGIHLDNRISWSTHIDQLHKKLMTNKMLLTSSCNILKSDCLKSVEWVRVNRDSM